MIIESVTGESFSNYAQKSILKPLEMNNTFMDFSEENRVKSVTGYNSKYPRKDREVIEHFSDGIMKLAEGMSSTVEDLMKFFQAQCSATNLYFLTT